MATRIYLEPGMLYGVQNETQSWDYEQYLTAFRGDAVIIAKGNVIEGIEAKW